MHHEGLVGYVVLTTKGETNCRKETEAWVIFRVPQYDHGGYVEFSASLKALTGKG
jgi:hypothetical protein